ncbi:MAG: T9SS type A sorting domain-containing protein [Bacteroidia bacterium]|nr:T9SS type A sorting domain-containing protein [Bacteroidia bacterium]
MKKLFTLAIALLSLLAVQAQTPITVLNADFEDTTTPLALNGSNQYAIKGFYLVDNVKKPVGSSLDAGNSGLVQGMGVDGTQALRLTCVQPDATANAAAHMFDVTTEAIDISNREFGEYTYKFQEKVLEAMGSIRPTGFTAFAYDANGLDVTTATLTVNKTAQTALNATTDFQTNFGYQTLGSIFSIKANATGLNAKTVKLAISIGKNLPATLTTSIYLDNFTLVGPAIAAGINTVSRAMEMNVYPNPIKDFTQINCPDGIDEVYLYSATGSLIHKAIVGTTCHKLDVSTLSNGIYLILVKNSKGLATTKINKF